MSKVFKPIVRIAAPVLGAAVGSVVPGVGTALGATLGGALGGAAGTAATGGNTRENLLGAGLGGLGGFISGGGLSSVIGKAAGAPLGGGLQGPTQGSGLLGGVTRSVPGLSGVVNTASNTVSRLGSGLSGLIGTKAGTPLSGGLQGPTQGTGILGGVTRAASKVPGLVSTSSNIGNIGGSMFGGPTLSSMLGGYIQNRGAEKQKDAILAQLNAARGIEAPYQEAGLAANQRLSDLLGSGELGGEFSAEDFETDPGYQFRLQEGQRALDRRLAAGGNYFSGDALRAAQQYGQGVAAQEYQDAFNRNRQQEQDLYNMLYGQQNLGAQSAGRLQDLAREEALTRAGAYGAKSNALSRMLGGFY